MHTAGLKAQNYRKSRDVQPLLPECFHSILMQSGCLTGRALINELENLETLADDKTC